MAHDCKRNGTTTLFAALDTASGAVIGQCQPQPQHRHDEFLAFLKLLDKKIPKSKDLHLVVDNYVTHKHAKVRAWLEKHPRIRLHSTPASASWLNLAERFFRDITEERIRRGVFRSIAELEQAICEYLEHRNENPKPYAWITSAESILKKIDKAKDSLNAEH
jgi:transposase